MNVFARITFAAPVTLRLPVRRPRIPNLPDASPPPAIGPERTFAALDACFTINHVTKCIYAQMPPLPHPLRIYGAADFAAAASDTPEEHAARVLEVLGTDPQTYLQALIDGTELPAVPARVPREISNWRCKAVLHSMGMLATVETMLDGLPEPQKTVANLAWNSDGKVSRTSETMIAMAAALNLTPAQIDDMFRAAEAIQF